MLKLQIKTAPRFKAVWSTVQDGITRTLVTQQMRDTAIRLCDIMAQNRHGDWFGGACQDLGVDCMSRTGAAELARQMYWQSHHENSLLAWKEAAYKLSIGVLPATDPTRGAFWAG